MAEPKRSEMGDSVGAPWSLPDSNNYQPGGPVGEMHAELAQRLVAGAPTWTPAVEAPAERAVRLLSMSGGWAALLGSYAGIAWLLLR